MMSPYGQFGGGSPSMGRGGFGGGMFRRPMPRGFSMAQRFQQMQGMAPQMPTFRPMQNPGNQIQGQSLGGGPSFTPISNPGNQIQGQMLSGPSRFGAMPSGQGGMGAPSLTPIANTGNQIQGQSLQSGSGAYGTPALARGTPQEQAQFRSQMAAGGWRW